MRVRRLDLWILGTMIVFGLAFVLGATWMGSNERARYKLEPMPPLGATERELTSSLGIVTPRFESGLRWLAAAADERAAIERRLACLDPDVQDPEAWLELALVRLLEDRAGATATAARHALSRHPRHVELHLVLGLALLRVSDWEGARRSFDAALTESPDDVDLLFVRGRLLLTRERFAEARADAERAVLLAPRQPELQRLLGDACLATHDMGRAKRAFNDVLQLLPEDEQARRMVKFLDGTR